METTRRVLLGLAATALTTSALPAGTAAAAPAPVPLDRDPVLHLLRRATYGPHTGDLAYARRVGASAWLEQQLTPARIRDTECDQALALRYPWLRMSSAQIRARYAGGDRWALMRQLQQTTLLRAATSRRQLFELMVEFWDNHLNITCPEDVQWDVRAAHDRDVVRAHALGRYEDLLVASAQSPAMLYYLDNASSRGTDPNENYGRELLELHSVGVGAGYTEQDVRQSALVLTGLSVDEATGAFRYRPTWHHTGPVRVLGWSHRNPTREGGLGVALDYVRWLARQPATARRIAHKLAVRFVADEPPAALVSRLASAYLAGGTAIVPVLRLLFRSPEFAASVGRKTRRPYEDAVAAMRAVGVKPTPGSSETGAWGSVVGGIGQGGHAPHSWPTPDGYPDVAAAWQSTSQVLARMQSHQVAVNAWWRDGLTTPPPSSLLGGARITTVGSFIDAVSMKLLHQRMGPAHRAVIAGYLELRESDPAPDWMVQSRVTQIATLILDSPYWSLR